MLLILRMSYSLGLSQSSILFLVDAIGGRNTFWHLHPVLAPGRPDQAHALDPFDRLHDIDGAEIRPPAVASLFHEGKPVQPFVGGAWWSITAEMTAIDFHVEQLEPVLESRQPNEFAILRQKVRACQTTGRLPHTPQAGRIETANDDLPFRYQHPLDFAQYLMRLGAQFQYMRQHHQIKTLRGKRQFRKIMRHHHRYFAPCI